MLKCEGLVQANGKFFRSDADCWREFLWCGSLDWEGQAAAIATGLLKKLPFYAARGQNDGLVGDRGEEGISR